MESFYNKVDKFCQRMRSECASKERDKDSEFNRDEVRLEYVARKINNTFEIRRGNFTEWESHSMNTVQTLMIFDTELLIWRPYKDFSAQFCYACHFSKNFSANAKNLADMIDVLKGSNPLELYIPQSYKGTRYQLFMNGIYDLKKDELIHPTEDTVLSYKGKDVKICDIGFTFKHLHRMNYPEKVEDPIYYHKGPNGSNWDFRHWLSLLCDDDDEKKTWLLGIVGLSILPNTNIGVNIMLKGESGSGKSVIGDLIQTIYRGYDPQVKDYIRIDDNNIICDGADAETFNEDFPFRNMLTSITNFIHVREMNGTSIEESGSLLYDKFADETMDAKQLHKQSNVLNPTPTLYMEGTDWARFSTVKNGVQRRTLPFEIKKSEELVEYVVNDMRKEDIFANKVVIDWLVVHAYKALRFLFNDRVENLQLNLNAMTLPRFMQNHMSEIMSGGNEINAFYDIILSRTLKCDNHHYISILLLHRMYRKFETSRGYTAIKAINSFQESIESVLHLHGLELVSYAFTRIENREQLALDLDELKNLIDIDDELSSATYPSSTSAKYKADWFYVRRIDENNDDEEINQQSIDEDEAILDAIEDIEIDF